MRKKLFMSKKRMLIGWGVKGWSPKGWDSCCAVLGWASTLRVFLNIFENNSSTIAINVIEVETLPTITRVEIIELLPKERHE